MKKSRTTKLVFSAIILVFLVLLFMGTMAKLSYDKLLARGHGNVITENDSFTESAKKLYNPNRGFYYMHGFRINDEETDFRQNIADRFCRDEETKLTLIEFNLQYYQDRPISEKGLENLEALFQELEKLDKQLIVRFVYDWNGENQQYEPESLDIILEHMRQVGPVLCKYKDTIFTLQGLFIGNWGEMNGTKYANMEDVQKLARQLAEVTDKSTFLSVRMPMFWRMATELPDAVSVERDDGTLASRLGLYNDGMLGSWSDYGTYGDHTKEEHGYFTYWNREEELAFQEELCKIVPSGGEVITDNSYNDFENALQDLKRMHVTYLNRDYDRNVLNKWENTTVTEDGVFQGMDGLSYVERHLGYRLLIKDTALDYQYEQDVLSVAIAMQNVGFAPLYNEKKVQVILHSEETGETHIYPVEQDIRDLTGGVDSEEILTLEVDIPLAGETEKNYTVYFEIQDTASGERILLANEQEPFEYGYKIGAITIEPIEVWKRRM